MTLAPGTKLGPYEILAPLGAGGMGEVWKAKDIRLDRFVAVKVLPEHLVKNADALARFEREAKAVAALNHPGILAIHDFGRMEGTAYAVMELLEGQSLRTRLTQGPLPLRKAVELAIQMAQGLAAAHGKGVVHRDLKPDNLWITTEGRLKILDFGLAKVARSAPAAQATDPNNLETGLLSTREGMVLGTLGYMSPEQVGGEPADARSDIFSFGVVLYELLTGRKAFVRDSAAATLAAILRDEPPEPGDGARAFPPGLRRILDRCLEKAPAHRFQDAQDLAFALEETLQASGNSSPVVVRARPWRRALAVVGVLLAAATGWWAKKPPPEPVFRQLSYRRGNILNARFTPDGQNVVYAASWDGKPTELFLARLDGTSTRPLGLAMADIQAINQGGELLVLLKRANWGGKGPGVLARMPLEGGDPKPLLERVRAADFGPDGKEIAAIYQPLEGGAQHLEFPLGHRLFESEVPNMRSLRVSPKGDRVAVVFMYPENATTGIALFDRQGHRTDLLTRASNIPLRIAWGPDGEELFFALHRAVSGVDLNRRERLIRKDSGLWMLDAAPGRILAERGIASVTTVVVRGGQEVNLAFSEVTRLAGMSADGGQLLLSGSGNNETVANRAVVRAADGSPPKDLGIGIALDQSADGQWNLVMPEAQDEVVNLVPTGTGVPRELRNPGWRLRPTSQGPPAIFTADSRHVLLWARQGKAAPKVLLASLDGAPARVLPIEVKDATRFTSADGSKLLALDAERRPVLLPLEGGQGQVLGPPLEAGESILGWDQGQQLVVGRLDIPVALPLTLIDLKTGRRTPWRTVGPAETSGVTSISGVMCSRDLQTVAYTYYRTTSDDLFVVDGIR